MKKNSNYIKWGITAFLVILSGLVSYYIIFHLDNFKGVLNNILVILTPITDGLILAYLLTPLLNIIERKVIIPGFVLIHIRPKKKYVRIVSILATVALVFFAIYEFFAMVIPQIINSIQQIIYQFPTYVDTLTIWISKLLENNPDIENFATSIINSYSGEIESFINSKILPQLNNFIMSISIGVYSVLKEFWNFIIGFIISIYVLAGKERFAAQFKKIAYAFLPVETSNRFISNVRFANKTFGGFFVGKILDSIIIGVICFAVTNMIGTPFCVLISVIIGVTNIIPFFGPFLGAIPSIILILFIDPIQAFYFIIFVIILQQVDGNVIGPKILGNSTGLSSFWVIFSITLFGGLFGIFGMVIGVPVFAVIFAFIKSLVESKLAAKELPTDTVKYLKLLYIDPLDYNIVDFSETDEKPFARITKIMVKGHKKLTQQMYTNSNDNESADDLSKNTDNTTNDSSKSNENDE